MLLFYIGLIVTSIAFGIENGTANGFILFGTIMTTTECVRVIFKRIDKQDRRRVSRRYYIGDWE